MGYNNWSYSKIYKEIKPYEEYGMYDVAWHDGMSAADGHIGVITSCAPLNDSFIFQNVEYIMPSEEPRYVPLEVGGQLDEARQSVINMDDTWDIHNRKRTNMYCHHPGHQLRVELCRSADITDTNALISEAAKHHHMTRNDDINITDYERYTDFNRSEIVVKYKADGRTITKRTFASLTDDVVITEITGAKDFIVNISVDDFEAMHKFGMDKNKQATSERGMKYSRFVKDDIVGVVAHYPSFEGSELAKGGFAGVTRILTDGDMRVSSKPKDIRAYTCIDENAPVINISHAESITLITYTDWTDDLGEYCEFRDRVNDKDTFALIDKCINKVDSADITEEPVSLEHKNIELKLDGGYFCESANEELLDLQKNEYDIMPHLLEKLYYNGLYGMQACAGTTAPRLSGLWVGEWNLLWRSAYTMDANVNIQVSGMNSSGLYEAGAGYMWFILRQIPDWVNNAAMVYGMKDAVLVPVNTDGHRAMMVEYDINYPFQYWNAGAGWMLIPIYEFLQTYGDAVITTFDASLIKMYGKDTFDVRKDVYEPLLKKAYNFWKQIGNPEYYTDTDGNARYEKGKCSLNAGEHYLIIPSFSPENKPFGYHSAITANAAMDISAAKDVINMYIEMINKEMAEENRTAAMQAVSEAEALLRLLPDFMYDESGAVKEWSMKEYGENNAHRHISHLYPAWPTLQTQHDSKLAAACRQAIINRNHENKGKDDTASHGWIHKALVEARLKNADAVYDTLNLLVHSDIFYTTLFTDHNTDRSKGVYCTDTAFGLVGIINEMLIYSDEHTIELLPAWSDKLGSGMVKGLRTRCGITIDELKWDVDKKKVYVSLDWDKTEGINVVCRNYEIEKIGHER